MGTNKFAVAPNLADVTQAQRLNIMSAHIAVLKLYLRVARGTSRDDILRLREVQVGPFILRQHRMPFTGVCSSVWANDIEVREYHLAKVREVAREWPEGVDEYDGEYLVPSDDEKLSAYQRYAEAWRNGEQLEGQYGASRIAMVEFMVDYLTSELVDALKEF